MMCLSSLGRLGADAALVEPVVVDSALTYSVQVTKQQFYGSASPSWRNQGFVASIDHLGH